MFALQLTFFSLLAVLLVAPVTSRWLHPVHCQPGQGAQDHLGRGAQDHHGRGAQGQHWQGAQGHPGKGAAVEEEEVRRWKMPVKSIWMLTFDKIHAEITERLKTKEEKRSTTVSKNPGDSDVRSKRSWLLPSTKVSPLSITRKMRKEKKTRVEKMFREILRRITIKNKYARMHR